MDATTKLTPLTRDLVLGSWRMISWTYRIVTTAAKTSTPAKNPLDGREVVHEVIYERATRSDV
jgi:hypothetical protein